MKGYEISVKELTFTPPKGNKKGILRGITFDVGSGSFISFIGRNGHGKTSVFKAILGELKHISGTVKVGNSIIDRSIHELCGGVGIVHQHVQDDLIFELTILRNIRIRQANSKNKTVNSESLRNDWEQTLNTRLAEFLASKDFTPTNDQLVEYLSGGQKQLLNVLTSIEFEHAPDIGCRLLLLDEHLTSLDKVIQKKIMELITNLIGAENRPTVLMITHDFEYALAYSDAIIVIYEGVVKERIEKNDHLKWNIDYLTKILE